MRFAWRMLSTLVVLGSAASGAMAAEKKPFIKTAPPCGTAENLYFCDTVRENREYNLNGIQVRLPAAGTALVTWSGNVFCAMSDIDDGAAANSLTEYYIHLALTAGARLDQYNEPGSASLGERVSVRATTQNVTTSRTILAPVTLTRAFPVTGKSIGTYRVIAVGDFRKTSGGFCNVNGGAMTLHYAPNP